jgi:glycosyltransferase involved in cell wall biosynthesis
MIQAEEFISGKATICIPHYKTLDFIRICLRSIRKFTNLPYQVIVVDNDSNDESLEYLRSLPWIKLIERRSSDGTLKGSTAEGSALDIGLKECNTEFYVAMHSDTFVQKANWLSDLIQYFNNDTDITCVGADNIDLRPRWQLLLKKATDLKALKRKLIKNSDPYGYYRYWNHTACCIYRTAVLKKENLSFMPVAKKGLTSGKALYFALLDLDYRTVELPSSIMSRYIVHLDHATQALNPKEFNLSLRTIKKCRKIMDKVISSEVTQNVLGDNSLDS